MILIVITITISVVLFHIIPLIDSFTIQRPLHIFDCRKSSNHHLRHPHGPAQLWILHFSTNNNNNHKIDNNIDDDDNDKTKIDWDGIGESQFVNELNDVDYDDEMIPTDNQVFDTTTTAIDDDVMKTRQTWMRPSSSSPLFSSTSQTPSSSTTRHNSNGVIVDEREVQLVSLFERTLPIQVVALLAIVCFTVYIGWSGGITDGSDRYTYSIDGNEDMDTTIRVEPEISNFLQQQQDSSEIGPSVFL